MKLLAVAAILMAVLMPLPAANRVIGFIDDDTAEVFDMGVLLENLFRFDFRDDEGTLSYYRQKQKQRLLDEAGIALDKAYASDNQSKIDAARESFLNAGLHAGTQPGLDEDIPASVFKEIEFDKRLYDWLALGDDQKLADYLLINGLDLLLMITSTGIDDLIRCRVFAFDGKASGIYEHISLSAERDFNEADLIMALMPYFYPPDSSLIIFDSARPAFASLASPDASPASAPAGTSGGYANQYQIVRPGIYEYFDEEEQGMKSIAVGSREAVHLCISPAAVKTSRVLVTGSSNQIEVWANGEKAGNAPLCIEGLSIPFTLAASQQSRKPLSFNASDEAMRHIHFDMEPDGMGSDSMEPDGTGYSEIYRKARNDFYWSFARSLIIFGTEVLISSAEGHGNFIKTAGFAVSGALLISLIDLISDLTDYYRAGITISR